MPRGPSIRIRLFAERWVTSLSLVKPAVALMKSHSMILPVSTSPERKFSMPSRRSALRKPGSRFTRARIVSLKSRVKANVVTFLPLDGGESGGKFRWRAIVQSWITERPGILWKSRRFSVATGNVGVTHSPHIRAPPISLSMLTNVRLWAYTKTNPS